MGVLRKVGHLSDTRDINLKRTGSEVHLYQYYHNYFDAEQVTTNVL